MDSIASLIQRRDNNNCDIYSTKLAIKSLNNHEMVLNPSDLMDQVLVACPNSPYCHQIVPRSQLPSHIEDWCNSILRSCPYRDLGCSFKAVRALLCQHKVLCPYRNSLSSTASPSICRMQSQSQPENQIKQSPNLPISKASLIDIQDGIITVVDIDCNINDSNLGLLIVGGVETSLQNIYIQCIIPGSAVDKDGRLQVGDQILEVNHCDLTQKRHEQAVEAFLLHRNTSCSVSLTVLRENNPINTKIISVKLHKNDSEILGLKMGGINNQTGVYIHEIIKGSQAWVNGGLCVMDRVLQVNQVNLLEYSHDKVTQIINNLHGAIHITVARKESSTDETYEESTPNFSMDVEEDDNGDEFYIHHQYIEYNTKEKLVSIQKQLKQQLGLTISGGVQFNLLSQADTPVYVANIAANSCLRQRNSPSNSSASNAVASFSTTASQIDSSCICRGDIILSVNNVDLLGLKHTDAVIALKSECEKCEKIDIRVLNTLGPSSPSSNSSLPDFCPPWSFWFALPSYYQLPREVILHKSSPNCHIGFSIVGGIDSYQLPQPTSYQNSPSRPSLLQIISRNKPSVGSHLLYRVMIRSILPGSTADKSHQLKCGDILLSVDDKPLNKMSHSDIVHLLKRPCTSVKLRIIRWPGSEI